MKTSLVTRIRDMDARLTAVERKIAQYFSDNILDLPGIGMPAVAQSCGVSKAAIVRMCKKLGYTGYKELRQGLAAELALAKAQERPEAMASLQGMTVAEVCTIYLTLAADIVREVEASMDASLYEEATRMINQHPHIRLIGWDDTAGMIQDTENSLILMGFATTLTICEHLRAASLKAVRQGDLVLMVASHQHLDEVNLARQMVSESGGFSIVITTLEDAHPPLNGSLLLHTLLKGHLRAYGSLESRQAIRLMLKTLMLCVASGRPGFTLP